MNAAGNSQATAASLANAFASGGSTASAYAAAVANAINQNGCGPYQQTLARAHMPFSIARRLCVHGLCTLRRLTCIVAHRTDQNIVRAA